jgi:hypothetical protein
MRLLLMTLVLLLNQSSLPARDADVAGVLAIDGSTSAAVAVASSEAGQLVTAGSIAAATVAAASEADRVAPVGTMTATAVAAASEADRIAPAGSIAAATMDALAESSQSAPIGSATAGSVDAAAIAGNDPAIVGSGDAVTRVASDVMSTLRPDAAPGLTTVDALGGSGRVDVAGDAAAGVRSAGAIADAIPLAGDTRARSAIGLGVATTGANSPSGTLAALDAGDAPPDRAMDVSPTSGSIGATGTVALEVVPIAAAPTGVGLYDVFGSSGIRSPRRTDRPRDRLVPLVPDDLELDELLPDELLPALAMAITAHVNVVGHAVSATHIGAGVRAAINTRAAVEAETEIDPALLAAIDHELAAILELELVLAIAEAT